MVVRTKPMIVGTNLWLWEQNNYGCGNKDLGLWEQIYDYGNKKYMVVGTKTYGCGNKSMVVGTKTYGCGNKDLVLWE
jgi:hypothetical protein